MRCGDASHFQDSCPRDRSEKTCLNCKGNHVVVFPGCPHRVAALEALAASRSKAEVRRPRLENLSRPQGSDRPAFRGSPVRSGVSYAQASSGVTGSRFGLLNPCEDEDSDGVVAEFGSGPPAKSSGSSVRRDAMDAGSHGLTTSPELQPRHGDPSGAPHEPFGPPDRQDGLRGLAKRIRDLKSEEKSTLAVLNSLDKGVASQAERRSVCECRLAGIRSELQQAQLQSAAVRNLSSEFNFPGMEATGASGSLCSESPAVLRPREHAVSPVTRPLRERLASRHTRASGSDSQGPSHDSRRRWARGYDNVLVLLREAERLLSLKDFPEAARPSILMILRTACSLLDDLRCELF